MFGKKIRFIDVDAVTLNPYMGYDSLKPFLKEVHDGGKGIFVLVKTSNLSSGDLQDRGVEGDSKVFEMVAQLTEAWGADDIGESGYSSVGAVVGATYPKEARRLRELMPQQIFLVPGYGAQGAGAKEVKFCFKKDGTGAIINSSRGIIFAYEESDDPADGSHFAQAARDAVLAMKKDLESII